MIGTSLLHYRIVEKLGEGGMGVVYKARDTHLDRFVAVKVMQAGRTADPDRKARFVQEAKAASALNHPNIIHVYDISFDSGHDFIAMEYVAGKTLDELIPRKGMRLVEGLKIAVQIADALARAHAAGIIHRDLKPANIMVDEHGVVKVLDFGLAKLKERIEGDEFASTATVETAEKPVTERGAIVGTVAYMSPEQAEGKSLDARSDIFSFGSVLYEMLTGRKAFQGDSKISTLSAVLHQEPKPLEDIPHELEKLVTRCLRKDRDRRAQHMADVKLALEELKEESDSGTLAGSAGEPSGKRGGRMWMAAGGGILAAAVAVALGLRYYASQGPQSAAPLKRLTSDTGLTTDPALSPDGRLVAYASDRAGGDNLDIWVQQVDGGGSPLRLTSDTYDESEPSFSPDGNLIVYRSERDGGGIYTIPVLGGEPRLIARGGRNPRFSPDGSRLAFVTGEGGIWGVQRGELFVIPSLGGTRQLLARMPPGAASPVWSPDGKFILFSICSYRPSDWGIVASDAGPQAQTTVLPLADIKRRHGLADLLPYHWTTSNRILFSARSGDSAHVFEIGLSPPGWMSKGWSLNGAPRRLTAGTELEERPTLAAGGAAASPRRLAFASLVRSEDLWSLELDTNHPRTGGNLKRLTQGGGFHIFPSVSRDGTKLAFISHAAYNDEVWLFDLKTGKRFLLSSNVSPKFKTVIHADGSRVIYDTSSAIFAVPTSGGAPEKLCEGCGWTWDWSGDQKRILHWFRPKTSVAGRILNLETGEGKVYLDNPGSDLYAFHWSPDGRWVTFFSSKDNLSQFFVAPYSGDQGPDRSAWIAITDGSTRGATRGWSPDGNWIYADPFRDGSDCIWAFPLDPLTKKPAGDPVAVFHSHSSHLSIRNANSVSQEISVALDKIVFNQGEIAGNIWMTEFNPE